MILRNVGNYLPINTASHPRTLSNLCTLLLDHDHKAYEERALSAQSFADRYNRCSKHPATYCRRAVTKSAGPKAHSQLLLSDFNRTCNVDDRLHNYLHDLQFHGQSLRQPPDMNSKDAACTGHTQKNGAVSIE